MHSYIKIAIVVIINLLLCIVFILASYTQWQIFQVDYQETFVVSHWGPFNVRHYNAYLINGQMDVAPTLDYQLNYPFLLFFVSTIANILLFVRWQKH